MKKLLNDLRSTSEMAIVSTLISSTLGGVVGYFRGGSSGATAGAAILGAPGSVITSFDIGITLKTISIGKADCENSYKQCMKCIK
jgi:hypothetical protein